MWERIGDGGRWAVVIGVQIIACLIWGGYGLFFYPILIIATKLMYRIVLFFCAVWLYFSTKDL